MSSQDAVYFDGKCIGFVGYRPFICEFEVYDEIGGFLGWAANKECAHAELMRRYELSQREDTSGRERVDDPSR